MSLKVFGSLDPEQQTSVFHEGTNKPGVSSVHCDCQFPIVSTLTYSVVLRIKPIVLRILGTAPPWDYIPGQQWDFGS